MAETSTKSKTKTRVELTKVKKRDGSLAPYDIQKIIDAIEKAMKASSEGSTAEAKKVAGLVHKEFHNLLKEDPSFVPEVESIQDEVEEQLMYEGYVQTAKNYILYRQEHAEKRAAMMEVSPEHRKLIEESRKYFRNDLSEFVYYTSYSKWRDDLGRRETWVETIDRFMDFMKENMGSKFSDKEYAEVRHFIINQDVTPSMRLLWSAGSAARNCNVAAYNCSFVCIDNIRAFGEIMYISMSGTGAGYSVESQFTQQLPIVQKQDPKRKIETIVVDDSKEGWAESFIKAMETWYSGGDTHIDYSKVRPAGSRLRTMGGRASGPEPLRALMEFAKDRVFRRQGKRLSNLDVHDIACKVGECVLAGGVRRSAMISISDLDDYDMKMAKQGAFYIDNVQRSMANNSAVYEEKPDASKFLEEWMALVKSGSGERGIWNRGSLDKQLPERRWSSFKNHYKRSGVNPCGEIVLRDKQFCNLTQITVRPEDTKETIRKKIEMATILGTYQASLTNFKFLSPEWKKNCDEEALLGVGITGYMDNDVIREPKFLQELKEIAVNTNKKYAKKVGVNVSTCVTCVKPSGNSSQLLDCSSGLHPRFAKYYIRRVRVSATDPVFHMLKEQGVPHFPEVGQNVENASTYVLEFVIKAPKGTITVKDTTAISMLEEWKKLKVNYTEHNPSATIYVDDDEWIGVADWIYKNWDFVGGLSFLPRSNHVYKLAPYEEIDEKTYKKLNEKLKNIDFSKLIYYEKSDKTNGAKELACVSGACEI